MLLFSHPDRIWGTCDSPDDILATTLDDFMLPMAKVPQAFHLQLQVPPTELETTMMELDSARIPTINHESFSTIVPTPEPQGVRGQRQAGHKGQQTQEAPSPHRRRGPGRPKKGEQRTKTSGKSSSRTYRREVHNDSAMRSRAKFNGALAALWNEVPERVQLEALGEDISRQIPRAEKVEIVISYIRSLETVLDIQSVETE